MKTHRTYPERPPWGPFTVGLVALAATVAATVAWSLEACEGHLVYAVDDAYIHMAMAKNLATSGVWGVTRFEFSSTSSSPLWTLLLAAVYLVAGVREAAPLVLNGGAAVVTLVGVERLSARLGAPAWQRSLALVASVFAAPLGFMVMVGMEHTLHAALTVWFMWLLTASMSGRPMRGRSCALACLSGALMATRYESAVLVSLAAMALLLSGRRRLAVACLICCAAPPAVVGMVSLANGWLVVPTSVVLKGLALKAPIAQGPVGPWSALLRHAHDLPHITALMMAAGALGVVWLARDRSLLCPRQAAATIACAVGVAHLALMFGGGMAMDLRYTGALVVLLCAVVGGIPWHPTAAIALGAMGRTLRLSACSVRLLGASAWATLVVPTAMMLGPVLAVTPRQTARACASIYRQQYQMARLARLLPAGTGVALNDIGAVCYYADVRCLDLAGLASLDVAQGRLSRHPGGRARLREVYADAVRCRSIRLGMVYDPTFDHGADAETPACPHPPGHPHVPALLPQEWRPLGCWWTPRNVSCAYDIVTVLAADGGDAELARLFAETTASLPRDMVARIYEPVDGKPGITTSGDTILDRQAVRP